MYQNFEMKNQLSIGFLFEFIPNLILTMELIDDEIELNNDTTVRFMFSDKPNCTNSDRTSDEDESCGPKLWTLPNI